MDKRRLQRVVLYLGLLFLFLLGSFFLFQNYKEKLAEENEIRLGYLVKQMPEKERDWVSLFRRPHNLDLEGTKEAGEKSLKKYGYENTVMTDEEELSMFYMGFSVLAALFLAGCAAAAFFQRKEERRLMECCRNQEIQIAEQKEKLELQKERLEKEERNTKALVTDISHQLKTPLASLKMCYEISENDVFTQEERDTFLRQGKAEVKKLENLTQALLQISRLESNIIQLHPQFSSLKHTLQEAVNSVFMKAFEKNMEIRVDEFQDITLFHDRRWTQEVFVNILDNAIKYSPEHTVVTIRVISMVSYYLIEIEDQGSGISKEEEHQIFKRFYRGQTDLVQKQEGAGVGLYLARRILEEQGGSIRVKSREKGSIFQMTLPKKENQL